MMGGNKGLHMLAYLILFVGGLNWLLVGLFNWDIGMLFGGQGSVVSRIMYVVVGLATVFVLATHKKDCKVCGGMGMGGGMGNKMMGGNTMGGQKMP